MPSETTIKIPSPCIGVCVKDPDSDICVGCYRTGEEIARWKTEPEYYRLEVLKELPMRRKAILKEKFGAELKETYLAKLEMI